VAGSFSFSDVSVVRLVKSLGETIGRASSVVKPSEFDGDGDGFRMGRDGRDNVPVAASAVVEGAGKAGSFSDALKAFKSGGKMPERLAVPDDWFNGDTERGQVGRNFPDFHLRWDEKARLYVPATGRLGKDSGAYDRFADAELASAYLKRGFWHPAVVPSDSRVAEVMRKWRSDFSESRALTRALAGLEVAKNFDSAGFRKDVEVLREALSDAAPLGVPTFRVARLTPDVGGSAKVGDELNFAAAAVAFSQNDAQGFELDELSGANAPSKFMFEFPASTRGLIFDDGGEKAAKRQFAEGGDKRPKEGIIAGKFRVARVEKREVKDPFKRTTVTRDVYVLESV